MMKTSRPTHSGVPVWLIMASGMFGLIVALILAVILRPAPAVTVSEVTREIREILLHPGEHPHRMPGGPIGSLWVFAATSDPLTGEFRHFTIQSDRVHLAAKRARLVVRPEIDAIEFDLRHVVFFRVPKMNEEDVNESGLSEMDRYTFGPISLGRRIIPDEGDRPQREESPLVTVPTNR